jgi:hypothetical protein
LANALEFRDDPTVTTAPTPAELLAGPRGRRLCWELLHQTRTSDGPTVVHVMAALQRSVDAAMYWQPPDDEDHDLRDEALAASLLPVAGSMLDAPSTSWWVTPVALDAQRYTQYADPGSEPETPTLAENGERLRAWRAREDQLNADFRTIREGRHPVVPASDLENTSGAWWSTPDAAKTTRELPGIGPTALYLVEDSMGWDQAVCWPVVPDPPVRVYEITGPESWAGLVRRHPLVVSDSRQPDWKRATSRAGHWLIPNWLSVADQFDAVHLTVHGYLTTAGRVVEVDDRSATLLAGWSPDETYWLTDGLRAGAEPTRWTRGQDTGWQRADP